MILVTGATGNVGAELLKILSASKQAVRAFVRDRSRVEALPGVDYAEGDFRNPATFGPALDGWTASSS